MGDLEKAAILFDELQASGIAVDEKAYSQMIHSYGKAGWPTTLYFLICHPVLVFSHLEQ